MEVQINRKVLDQLLLEMGVPEEKIKSLRVVIRQEKPGERIGKVGLLRRLIAFARILPERILPRYITLGAYSSLRHVLTLYPDTWLDQEEATRIIAHESAHMKQGGTYRDVLLILWQILSIPLVVIPILTYLFLTDLLMSDRINHHYPGLPQLVPTVLQLVSLLIVFVGWEVLWRRTTSYLRSRLSQEREAWEFADAALLDPRWHKVIKIKKDRKPQS